MYDPAEVQLKTEDLTQVGIESLKTAEEVDEAVVQTPGTILVVINSVCKCEGGNCRDGVKEALQNKIIPDRFATVFAGVDKEAVDKVRELMPNIEPSSPCVALFKDGKLVRAMERKHIEGMDEEEIAEGLSGLFNKHCTRQGPAVERDESDESKSSIFSFFKKKR